MINLYVKKFNWDMEVSIESTDEYGNTKETFIANYFDKMILFIYEDQVIVAAKSPSDISHVVKVDRNNALIIKQNGEMLGAIRDPGDIESVIGAENVKAIEVIFTKMLLEQTEKQYESPFGEIHENVRRI